MHQDSCSKQHAGNSTQEWCPHKAVGKREQRGGPCEDQQDTHEEPEDHPPPDILSENLFVEPPSQRFLYIHHPL